VSDLPDLMTAPEVMAFLRISQTTLKRWIAAGKITVSMVGGRQRFARADVLAQIEVRP
jgi:excisionase family DNA binding protein